MANVPMPPNQTPGQVVAPDPFQPASDVPGLPPGTFEYVDASKKRNWKRVIEISVVVVFLSIPLVLSLFKVDYSIKRTYEILNPASFATSPSYSPWSSFITTAKKIIQPDAPTTPKDTTNSNVPKEETTPTNTPTVTPRPTALPTQSSQEQPVYSTPDQPQSEQGQVSYPTEVPTEAQPASDQIVEDSPTETPVPPISAYAACYGKHKQDKCAYSVYGNTVEGRCRPSFGNYLICVKEQ